MVGSPPQSNTIFTSRWANRLEPPAQRPDLRFPL